MRSGRSGSGESRSCSTTWCRTPRASASARRCSSISGSACRRRARRTPPSTSTATTPASTPSSRRSTNSSSPACSASRTATPRTTATCSSTTTSTRGSGRISVRICRSTALDSTRARTRTIPTRTSSDRSRGCCGRSTSRPRPTSPKRWARTSTSRHSSGRWPSRTSWPKTTASSAAPAPPTSTSIGSRTPPATSSSPGTRTRPSRPPTVRSSPITSPIR